MNTYFIRHTSSLDVDTKTIRMMWEDDRIAIHYPRDKSGGFEIEDSRSLNPDDYDGVQRSMLKRLIDLAREGGYVFATYRGEAGSKIGYVTPGSTVELFHGTWGSRGNRAGREAVLKSLKLTHVHNIPPEQTIAFTPAQPRQGTFCRWRRVGDRVANIVNGVSEMGMDSLTPDLQEVMCLEYLRTERAREQGLPVLRCTLMPVGRTMKDIDILGVSESGKTLSVQVTYKCLHQDDPKLQKLDPYQSNGNETVFFCRCKKPQKINGHFVFPLQKVFEDFCIEDDNGRQWFERVMGGAPARVRSECNGGHGPVGGYFES